MRDISRTTYSRLQTRLEILDKEIQELSKSKEEAREKGDLSENTEYEAASAALEMRFQEKANLEHILKTSTIKQDYSNSIAPGTLLSIKLIKGDNEEDLGLMMFDNSGSAALDGIINPSSPLGAAIQGGNSGRYKVKGPQGNTLEYSVIVEPESRIEEFLAKYPISRATLYSRMFGGV